MKLSDEVRPHARFSRSINVESDNSTNVVETYLPTGRALDVVRRLARGLDDRSPGRAFSITGPHGSGKSSLAVFLGALLSGGDTSEFRAALELLASIEPEVADQLVSARSRLDVDKAGFVLAIATAEREPVIASVARALAIGSEKMLGRSKANPIPRDWVDPEVASKLTPRDIRDRLEALTKKAPVFLLIDEFGKNLEAYADSGRDGDPYLLQELAEWASRDGDPRLVIVTMQHLAFDEYVQESSTARRREWVKVQGRFEDIAYVETAAQSRRLIGSAFIREEGPLTKAVSNWVKEAEEPYRQAGLRELLDDAPASYPLHPLALAVLPELCSRYGQNERTLFSFLAGPEPTAVPAALETSDWQPKRPLPFVRLPEVYDYFTASAATMISSAATGSRWVEIESRIRDTIGLTPLQSATLKSVGVLNLVSAGGTLRASRHVLALALTDGTTDTASVLEALTELESKGLVTYRDFADEYRIWQGSDFDLKGAVAAARRRSQNRRLEELLNEACPQQPLVASRHSQMLGTLRVFQRRFSSLQDVDLTALAPDSQWDGTVLLSVNTDLPELDFAPSSKPVVVVTPKEVDGLHASALDAAALSEALRDAEAHGADWVARRELIERLAEAQGTFQHAGSSTRQDERVNDGANYVCKPKPPAPPAPAPATPTSAPPDTPPHS